MVRTFVGTIAAVVALTGCSGSDINGNDEIARGSIEDALEADYPGGIDSACVAEEWVTEVGTDTLQQGGLLADDFTVTGAIRDAELTPEGAAELVDAAATCDDLATVATDAVVDLFDPTEEQESCLAEAITEENARAWFVADLSGSVADNIFVVAGRGCMSTPALDATATTALAESLANGRGFTPEQSACVAEGLIQTIGVYELTAAKVLNADGTVDESLEGTPLNLTDATYAADAALPCLPKEELLSADAAEGASPRLVSEFNECVQTAISDEAYRQYLIDAFMGVSRLQPAASDALADCLRPLLESQR